jgi:hypothetical protein
MPDHGTEFVCADCGAHVFQAIAETPRPDPQLCFQCQWLATFNADDPLGQPAQCGVRCEVPWHQGQEVDW